MSLRLRTISREDHLAFLKTLPSVSFLQCPSWGEVKTDWRSESIGWIDDAGQVVGAALVLLRPLPRLRRYLAYLPEGPVIDWAEGGDLRNWLNPMLAHLKSMGAFSVKMGPPVVTRTWEAETVKKAIAEGSAKRLADVPADRTDERALDILDQLRTLGWRRNDADAAGFGDFQPRYVFQLPFVRRSLDEVQAGFNQLWRRNIKKADKAGVEVVQGGADDLPAFHRLYVETAERDHFRPRPLSYFQRMFSALNAEHPDRIRLYLARHEGDLVAATTMVTVGEHAWYSYGASSTAKREVRGSNAVQWRMMRDAYAAGASVYDLRGISDTLDEKDHLFGLIQFKLGTGGHAVEYAGEWDYPLNRVLHKALEIYMARR